MTEKTKKPGFPILLFIILFLIESIIGLTATAGYFIISGKNRIEFIEEYTKNYSISLADAFSTVAEINHKKKKNKTIKSLFDKKIKDHSIDEAFFVLLDGKIIAHSDKNQEKKLSGNVANDEFKYNLDLILKQAKIKSREILFTDYNIIGQQNPFDRRERDLIKKYLYKNINKIGWLVSKAVYKKKKAIGTVNFLINKNRIHDYILTQEDKFIKYTTFIIPGAFILSLIFSLFIFIRYRKIQVRGISGKEKNIISDKPEEKKIMATSLKKSHNGEDEFITIELLAEIDNDSNSIEVKDISPVEESEETIESINLKDMDISDSDIESLSLSKHIIKDAIPVVNKGQS